MKTKEGDVTFTDDQILKELRAHINQELARDEADDQPGLQDDLIALGVIDSLSLFTLVTFIESKFGVAMDPDELVMENFHTLDAVRRLVRAKLS